MLDRASRRPKVWMSVWISVALGLLIGLIAPVASAAPCIGVDCSAFDTECSTASCDPIPPEDNCDTLTFLPPSTVCNPGSGDLCDPDETCTGSSPDCPADVFEPATAICNEGSSSVTVTLAGFSVNGITSLSTDPISGLLYGILKTAGGSSGRRLVTIDTITGVATDIGPLPDGFANIEFGAAGLFGVTGDGAPWRGAWERL